MNTKVGVGYAAPAQQSTSSNQKAEAFSDQPSTQSGGSSLASSVSKEFITLLSAQMQNQDPSNPMESHEMTAQLAQIAALEQQEGTNQLMAGLIGMVGSLGNFSALNTVGKDATVLLDKFKYDGEGNLSGGLDISGANEELPIKVEIKDKSGKVIKENDAEIVDGEAKWEWDGTDSKGNKVPEGDYEISASQTTEIDGKKETIDIPVTTTAKIESINFLNGTITMSNGVNVSFGGIISVAEPDGKESDGDKDDEPVQLPSLDDDKPVTLPETGKENS